MSDEYEPQYEPPAPAPGSNGRPLPPIIEEIFWQSVVPHILNRTADSPFVRIKCLVCLDNLKAVGLPDIPGSEPQADKKSAMVWPCGHMFCDPCSEDFYFDEHVDERLKMRCPCCRMNFKCGVCNKEGYPVCAVPEFSLNTVANFIGRFPQTVTAGQTFHDICSMCTVNGDWLMHGMTPGAAVVAIPSPGLMSTVDALLNLELRILREGLEGTTEGIDEKIQLPYVSPDEVEPMRQFHVMMRDRWTKDPNTSRTLWG